MKKVATLEEIMIEAKKLISNGFSVLPLRMPDKRPIGNWKEFQSKIITAQEFFEKLNKHNGDVGLGIVCGTVSGNMECLDVDDKYLPGVAIKFLKELNETYPEIYSKLRIEKTINHGVHIPYRISDGKSGRNRDLAKRHATPEELENRPDLKTYSFFELKGEGGKFTAPPTDGYSFFQELEIPTISRHEADLIINLATLYNEVIPEPKQPFKKSKSFRNYSTNPWEDFNSSDDAVGILERHGWKRNKDNQSFSHFSKPDSKTGSVSASYIKRERFYYIFSTSSNLDAYTGYSPSSLLCELEFNGDTKECYKYLISQGYGVFTEVFEEKLLKNSVINKKELPANVSEKSKDKFEIMKNDHNQKYPFGIFWEGDLEDGFKINKELILRVAGDLGFQIYDANICMVNDNEVSYPQAKDFYETLKSYIKIDVEEEPIAVLDKFEDYLQK